MFAKLFKALDVERGEERMVMLLILQSFFIGVFNITLSVAAETMFLQTFEENMIGRAYMFSGVAGIVMTAFYSRLQSAIKFSTLAFFNLLTIAAITAGIWYSLTSSPNQWIIFGLFVMMGPLLLIPIVGFGGMVLRMFTLRQGKRLFGLVDSGMVFGIIIVGFLLPLLLGSLSSTQDLLLISAAGLIVALLFQTVIVRMFDIDKKQEESKQEQVEEGDSSYGRMFKDPYIRMMSLFVAITMVALFFVQYSFLSVTKAQYPEEQDLASFLSSFTSAMMILSFLIKTFVYSKLVKTYGLKVSFLILPIVLALFTVGAVISGHAFGFDPAESNFLFFFLLIALSRLFSVALKEAIQNPSFKILYQSLDKNIRFSIQAKIDGVVNEVAASLAGGILAGLGLLTFIGLIHYSYILVAILGLWSFLAIKLYNEYRDSLQLSLSKLQSGEEKQLNISHLSILKSALQQSNNVTLGLISKLMPVSSDKEITKSAELPHDPDQLRTLARNKDINKRIELAKTIKDLPEGNIHELSIPLNELLKDPESEVRIEAIKAIAKQHVSELYHLVIDQLDSSLYCNAAYDAIQYVGEDMLDLIELSFHKTGLFVETRVLMIKAMGDIGGAKAINLLLNKISHPDRKVVDEAFISLQKCDHSPDENQINKYTQEVDIYIGIAAWNIAAKKLLDQSKASDRMLAAIDLELKKNFDAIYLLLGLAYDSKSVNHIKESIESGSSESIGFAIELLDLFVAEDLKPKLFPLLEDISEEDRIAQLELNYAIEQVSIKETLVDIINKDYNFYSKWTKLCAIHELNDVSEDLHQVICANIFNPDRLIRESAAWVTYNKDSKEFFNLVNRIDEKEKSRLIALLVNKNNSYNDLLFAKLSYLKDQQSLAGISDSTINEITKHSNIIVLKASDSLTVTEEDITYIVMSGILLINENPVEEDFVFGTIALESNTQITALEETKLFAVNNSKLYELITLEPELLSIIQASTSVNNLVTNVLP